MTTVTTGERRAAMQRQRHCRRFGFSLIEVMSVVAIMGILLLIGVPAVFRAGKRAKIKEAENQLQFLRAAIKQLAYDTGKWPRTEGTPDWYYRTTPGATINIKVPDLTTDYAGLLGGSNEFPNWKGPYLLEIPLDPWGTPYWFDPDYTLPSGEKVIAVGSSGPNRSDILDFSAAYDSDNIYIVLD